MDDVSRDVGESEVDESHTAFWSRTAVQVVVLLVAGAAYFLAFGGPGLGFGLETYLFIVANEALLDWFALGCVVVVFVLYVFDFSYWQGFWYFLKSLLLCIVGISFVCAGVLASKRYPGASTALYVLLFPGFCWLLKYALFRDTHTALFMKSMSIALMVSAVLSFVAWITWLSVYGFWWGQTTKWLFGNLVLCESVPARPDVVLDDDNFSCLQAWVLWASPFLMSMNAFVFSILSWILSNSMRQTDKPLTVALKLFLAMLAMAAVCLWAAASVAGAGLGVSGAVQLFVGVFVMVLSGVVISTVGWKTLQQQLMAVPLIRQMTASLLTDWFKAIFLLGFAPVLPFYFIVSLANQFFRKVLPFGYHIEDPEERKLWLTKAASSQLQAIKSWRWTSVLIKIMWIGMFYVLVNVGVAKIVTIVMSMINGALVDFPFWAVTLIFFAIGITMFWLPPVPGLPVYLSGGIILGKQGEVVFGSFAYALIYACVVCYVLKLVAIYSQQRIIGEKMSVYVSIRRMVGVNSVSIRAIRKVLEQPGIRLDKVCILIGGPDWPTSTLTGILRLSRVQMLIGSSPVILLVAPMTLAGGFLLKEKEGGLWGPVASVTLALAALSQMIAMLSAFYYVSEAAERHYDELANMPEDEEVAKADRASEEVEALSLARTSWYSDDFPMWMRVLLISGTVALSLCVYILAIAADLAFQTFSVIDTVEDKLDGNVLNVILDLGWVCIGLVAWGTLVLIVFGRFTAYRVKHLPPNFVIPDNIRSAVEEKHNRSKTSVGGGVSSSVANATERILRPDAAAATEAQAAKARKKAIKAKLKANAAFKDDVEAGKVTKSGRVRKGSRRGDDVDLAVLGVLDEPTPSGRSKKGRRSRSTSKAQNP